MEILEEMKKSFASIDRSILDMEINKGNSLRDESNLLMEKMFSEDPTDSDKEVIKDSHLELLERFKEFESRIVNFEILNFLYATFARVALNGLKFDIAVQYAQAGIEVNLKQNDAEGVNVNRVVLLDTACLMGAFKEALNLIDAYPNVGDKDIKEAIKNMPSKNDVLFQKLLKSAKRPKSLTFCLDDKLRLEEKAIRTVMLHMGISRNEALRYKKAADELPKDYVK